ncbi:MAG: hypothetical protein K0B05_07750, partial [Bacteroidales bacterium]|nr:hypothetical protein [Bacteroidales bacterium]
MILKSGRMIRCFFNRIMNNQQQEPLSREGRTSPRSVKDNIYICLTFCLNIQVIDSEIINLVLQGDRNRYRLLVEKYQQMIFQTAMGFLHNRDDADDLTQEVFIQAYQSLNRFKGQAAFSTW